MCCVCADRYTPFEFRLLRALLSREFFVCSTNRLCAHSLFIAHFLPSSLRALSHSDLHICTWRSCRSIFVDVACVVLFCIYFFFNSLWTFCLSFCLYSLGWFGGGVSFFAMLLFTINIWPFRVYIIYDIWSIYREARHKFERDRDRERDPRTHRKCKIRNTFLVSLARLSN